MTEQSHRTRAVLSLVGFFFILWMGWVLLLLKFPMFSGGFIRAIVRLFIWLGTAFGFVCFYEKKPLLKHLKLRVDVARGIVWGLACSAVILIPSITYRLYFSNQRFHWPRDVSIWLNPILTAPLCEEILFRGAVFQGLRARFGFVPSALISSLLFSLIHWPYWYLSGSQIGLTLTTSLVGIFIQGTIFSWLLERSQSLWASLVYHLLNNLVGQSFA